MATKDRHAIHAYVSKEAHDNLKAFTEDVGVSVTALVETLGLRIFDIELTQSDFIKAARGIDAQRRRRG